MRSCTHGTDATGDDNGGNGRTGTRADRRKRRETAGRPDPATGAFRRREPSPQPVSYTHLVDPIVDETDQPYVYTGGDPVINSDPSGLTDVPAEGAIEEDELIAATEFYDQEADQIAEADAALGVNDPIGRPQAEVPTGNPVTGENLVAVSYTHLDVYKRQHLDLPLLPDEFVHLPCGRPRIGQGPDGANHDLHLRCRRLQHLAAKRPHVGHITAVRRRRPHRLTDQLVLQRRSRTWGCLLYTSRCV